MAVGGGGVELLIRDRAYQSIKILAFGIERIAGKELGI